MQEEERAEGQKPAEKTGRKYVVECAGERFMWIRLLPGWQAKLELGEEIKVEGQLFTVKGINGKRIMLEGAE